MTLRLNGTSSGFTEIDAPAAAGSNKITLPTSNGSAEQFLKNSGTAGELEFSSMVETSTGVGIGTSSPSALLHLNATSPTLRLTGSSVGNCEIQEDGSTLLVNVDSSNAKSSSALAIRTDNVERARIDPSGRLLVGKTSHSGDALFVVESNHTSGGIIGEFDNNDAGNFGGIRILGGVTDRECRLQSLYGNSFFTFYTEGTGAAAERMRITEEGVVTINRSTGVFDNLSLAKLHTYNNEADKYVAAFHHDGNNANRKGIYIACGQDSGTGTLIQFEDGNGSTQGNITFSSGSTSYNTSSDYRLKENIVDLDGAITRVKQLAPKRFNFIDQERTVDGFLAHEAQTVVPEAVTGTHNEVDEDDNPIYQGIDQSKLVPLLTAALQEAIGKIETLETQNTAQQTQIDDLLARVTALEAA